MVIEGLGTHLPALLLRQEPTLLFYIGEEPCLLNLFVRYCSLVDVIRSSADAPEVVEKVAREFKIKANLKVRVCF